MIVDGLTIAQDSDIYNAHIESGITFPLDPRQGRLFYLDTNDADEGLYIYNGTQWVTGDVTAVIAGSGLTGGGTRGAVTLSIDTSVIAPLNNTNLTGTTTVGSNLLPINKTDTGNGVTAGTAGIEVKRGVAADGSYFLVFDETDDLFKVGNPNVGGGLEIIATRQWVGTVSAPVDHVGDFAVHLTPAQNTLLDGLSAGLTSANLNACLNSTGNFQTQIDSKVSSTGGTVTGALALTLAPTDPLHAANKAYVDGVATGLDLKASVKAATENDIVLDGEQTVDGVALIAGDRVLVKNQIDATANGIYVVAAGPWVRSTDADNSPAGEVSTGMFCFVEQGTKNAASGWTLTTPGTITLGASSLIFSQFSSAGQTIPGAGLTATGLQIDVVGTPGRIVANADSIDLDFSGVNPGDYPKVTVDAYGRVTAGAALVAADLPADGYASTYVNVGGDTMTGYLTLHADPVNAKHAVTKQYVDGLTTGLDFKQSVRAATTAGVTLSGLQVIDGVTLQVGDRVLVKNQASATENGIYSVTVGTWYRSVDADVNAEVSTGMFCFVEEGSTNASSGWVLSTPGPITVGTTGLTFTQFNGLGQTTAGNGLVSVGNTINAVGSSGRIVVNADSIDLAATGVVPNVYKSVLVDTYGRVIGGQNPTTLAGYGITDAASASHTHSMISSLGDITVEVNNRTISGPGNGLFTYGYVGGNGPSQYGEIVSFGGGVTAGQAEMAISWSGTPTAYIRSLRDTIDNWTAWYPLLSSANFNTYAPTLTGTGASGTWTIDILGNATTSGTANALSVARTIAVTGGVSGSTTFDGSGNVSIATTLNLPNVGTPGTYAKVTTDAQGRVTAGAALAAGDLPADGYATTYVNVSGDTMTGPLTLSADPVNAMHAATKQYVDNITTGLDFKQSVRVATTANITLSGVQVIDGISVSAGDRVLVKNQTVLAENGIYVVAAGAWARATDADGTPANEVTSGMFCFVEQGTANAVSGWVLNTANPITVGTTGLSFTQFNGLGQVTAGAGMTQTGNVMDVVGTAGRIVVNADSIDLATSGAAAGTYKSVTVDVYGRVTGGTNPTTLAGYGITDAQPLDADLTAISALAGTSGILKKTALNTWALDTATYVPTSGASYVQSTGLSTSWGTTSGVNTGAFNAIMGTGASATWLISGTSGGVFRAGIQALDAADGIRVYSSPTSFITITNNGIEASTVIAATFSGALNGNAATATKLATARTISLTTDVTGSVSFDGSGNAAIATTLSATGVTAGAYKSVTVDAKGRVTAGSNPTTLAGYGITDAAPIAVGYQAFTATQGQTVFNITNFTNVVGSHRMMIFVNGIKQTEASYTETATTFTLSGGLTAGASVEVYFR